MKKLTLVIGSNGQLGRAIQTVLPSATFVDQEDFDLTNDQSYANWDWGKYDVIINAAAYTAVDEAETTHGRITAWQVNAMAVARLAKVANRHNLTLVHVSSEYVFDGRQKVHSEKELFSPLGVYGQSKAAGDIAASTANQHYIIRTSWVVGDGKNFVRTMKNLSEAGVKPKVVNDQTGRLTFTQDLAEAIVFLLAKKAPYGTYNFSNDGPVVSWADLAKRIFELSGRSPNDVSETSSQQYFKDKPAAAPRPSFSALDLRKIKGLGLQPRNWEDALGAYLQR